MFRKCVVLLLVLVVTSVNTRSIKSRSKRYSDNGYYLPTYVICLIGIFMILMFLIITGLIYVLWKQRCNTFKRLSTQDAYVKYEKSEYEIQDSIDVRRPLRKINSNDKPYINVSSLTVNSAIGDVVDTPSPLQSPSRIENDIRRNPKRCNKKVPDESIMRKEQIDQVIKNALSKSVHDETASLRNLNELLSEANKKDDRPLDNIYDKAASTPELEVYDVLPTSRSPIKVLNDDDYDPPEYDCPSSHRNLIIPIMEGRYVTPILIDDSETEPSYINAHMHRFKN